MVEMLHVGRNRQCENKKIRTFSSLSHYGSDRIGDCPISGSQQFFSGKTAGTIGRGIPKSGRCDGTGNV